MSARFYFPKKGRLIENVLAQQHLMENLKRKQVPGGAQISNHLKTKGTLCKRKKQSELTFFFFQNLLNLEKIVKNIEVDHFRMKLLNKSCFG